MDHVQEPTWREDMLLFTQFAVDNLSDAAYWIKQDASIIYVNTAACQMLGYTGEELLAKRIYELNPDITEHDWSEVWNRLRDAGRRTFEGRHITKDGRLIPIEICANFLKFNGQEYSCAFTRDITERKRLQQRLSQAEKMDAIGRLAGGVAHDFNNQLTGIIGCADLLEIECKDSVRSLQLVRTIHQLAERASDLTSQLLAFARKGKYRTEPVDVHTLLAEVEGILLRSVDKKITIETRALAATAMVLGDPSQLQNTILNLALNARDAMPTGGTLTLATENISVDQKFCSNQAFPITPGNYVLLRVQDTGQGMATDVLKRIFEPFYTTKELGKGTGLGLAAVYGTVQNHKGAIDISSELGKGTEARLYLRVAEGVKEKPQVEPDSSALLTRAHVVVVDDEPLICEVACQLLTLLGCTVTPFLSGKEALDYYTRAHDKVDLVLLDMGMPVMDGKETYLAMRRINPGIKALICSGYALDGDARSLLNEGVNGFIQKPYRAQTLAKQLQQILNLES